MEIANLTLLAAAAPDEPLARFALFIPEPVGPGEVVCRLAQTRWRDGQPREHTTPVRGEYPIQALCLAIRLVLSEIDGLRAKHGDLVDDCGAAFDPQTLGLLGANGQSPLFLRTDALHAAPVGALLIASVSGGLS